jgi:hypothetical protein
MTGTPASSILTPTLRQLFPRWRCWLDRLDGEFTELLQQQKNYHALRDIWNRNIGRLERGEIGRSMAQGYVAFACTAIRRLVEPPRRNPTKNPKKDPRLSISLVILLRDIQENAHLFTRDRLRKLYRRKKPKEQMHVFVGVADRVFNDVVKNPHEQSLPSARIDQEVRAMNRATRRIERFVDKTIAHHERNLIRVGRPIRFDEIDEAIEVLLDCYRRYSLFVTGQWCYPGVEDDDDLDIRQDLMRVWPDALVPEAWGVGKDELFDG